MLYDALFPGFPSVHAFLVYNVAVGIAVREFRTVLDEIKIGYLCYLLVYHSGMIEKVEVKCNASFCQNQPYRPIVWPW